MISLVYKKGFYMLVSAISSNPVQIVRANNSETTTKGNEANDTAFNSLNSYIKRFETAKMYDSINEWKDFCHKQILNGNLDVII